MAAIAAVVLAGVPLSGELTATTDPAPTTAESTQRVVACPGLVASGSAESVGAVVLPGAAPGMASLTIGGDSAVIGEPGGGAQLRPAIDGQSGQIESSAGFADMTGSVRDLLDAEGEGRGLAVASCAPPAAEHWFVGVTSLPGRIDEILLANPTPTAAIVSVAVHGPDGVVSVPGADGVVVQPGGQGSIRVDSLVQDLQAAAIHLTTTGGVVSAQLRSTAIDGLIPQGAAYLPPAGAPAELLVLPGIPSGEGERTLVLTAPQEDVAVDVALIPTDGATKQYGQGRISVAAGTTVAVDLTEEWNGQAGAVSLAASGPIVAAARSQRLGTTDPTGPEALNRVPVADYAWVAGAAPVVGQSHLPVGGSEGTVASVFVVAVNGEAEVEVSGYPAAPGGSRSAESRMVSAGTVEVFALPVSPGQVGVGVVAKTGGDGTVFAAVVQSGGLPDGPLLSSWPAVPLPVAVSVPAAYPDAQVLTGG